METKILKSINLIRCVSGANLNLFRYTAMVVVLLLGVSESAWGNSDYYTKVTLSKAGTGSGKVYAQKGATTGTWTENGTTSAKDSQSSAQTHTWYLKATPDDGSAFTGWGSFNGWQSNPSADGEYYKGTIVGNTNANNANGTATATFVPVEVNEISATSHTFSPLVNAKKDCNSYKQTITFTTKYADAMVDFVGDNAVLTKTEGDGVFSLDGAPSIANNTVTATVKFTGNDRYAATPGGSRTNTATLTLTSKGSASQTKTCTFTATFPSASVTSGKLTVSGAESDLYATNTNPVNGNVEFAVMYADALGDFTLPTAVTEKSHSGDTWSIGTITGPNTNYETGAGKIVIPITFTSEEGKYGDHTAKITLGGVTVTMTAHVEELADYDVKVVDADGTTVLHKGAWGDDAFSALNGHAGSTLIVGRDFNIGSVSSARAISQNVTLDLNGKAVTATLTAAGSLLSVTSGKTLTIGGVKGGSLSVTGNVAGRIAIVEVQNGSLNLQRGDLEITNSNSGSGTESNPYAAGVYLASRAWSGGKPTVTMAMSGGSITAKRTAGGYGYGICCAGSGTSASAVDLTGGTITAQVTNGNYAVGVYVSGPSSISDMTINASSTQYAYGVFTGASDSKIVIDGGTYTTNTTSSETRALLARGNVTVMRGTFSATATSGAYGIFVSNGTVVVNNGNFSATATAGTAFGISIQNSGAYTAKINGGSFSATGTTAAYAANTTTNTTLITTAGTFTAEASGTNTDVKAYGLNLVANATANVAGATFRGITSGNAAVTGSNGNSQPKGAYGIFNLGNLTVADCTLEGQSAKTYAYGLYTTQSVTMTGTSLSAETSGANGADHATALYINGSGKTVTAEDCSFSAVARTTYAYGVYAYAGILESNNSNYFAETKQTGASSAAGCLSRGIYNNSGTTVTLNGGEISCIGNASYSQNAYGIYTAGTATITDATISCTSVKSGYALYAENTNATMTVNSGKFKGTTAALYIDTSKKPKKVELYGGFYSHDTNLKTYKATGCEVYNTPDGSVEKEQGYNFKVADGSNPGVVVAKVYNSSGTLQQSYNTLVEALQFVNANSGTQYTIVMVADYVLPAGEYTLPNKATLVVPDVITRTKAQITQTSEDNKVNRVVINTPAPTLAVKLTMADGANLTAYGTIEATANQAVSNGGQLISGATTGPYGQIEMNAGSSIQLESGSSLVCWGYITGKGQITANRGSKIYEHFQLGYWRGGTATKSMINNRSTYHAFPVTDYFYQNIEAPILYRPGADAYGYTGINYTLGVEKANNIHLVGTSGAMFLMDNSASEENTWIRKEYDPTTDRVEWKMNSGAKLGDFSFSMILTVNSADYYLPITNNMTIIIEDGECEITQDAVLLPGAKIIINKTAKLVISSGKKLFCVDADDWSKVGSYYFYTALYSPSWASPSTCPRNHGTTSAPIKEADAEIFVHGETEGWYYTTAHGANIHSTNADAGKVKFIADAGSETTMKQCTSTGPDYVNVDFTSAQLKNEIEVESSYYTQTTSAKAGYAYIYEDQQWIYVHDGCLTTRTDATGTHYYARPGDNVAVLENEDDAAYHGESEANRDRNFIFTEKSMGAGDAAKCVWWEATKIGDIDGDGKIYYMANKEKYENYGAYYYYKSDVGYWVPRYVSITWSYQVDGSAKSVTYNSVYYHTSPVFAEFTNPHKKDDATYSYAWTGWTDEDGLFYAKDGVLPLATKNTTYTAVFEATRLQGSVSFKNYNGGALESRLFDSETIPTCSLTPTRSANVESVYTFDGWSTSAGGNKAYEINGLPTVVKNTSVTYYAHFSASPRPYVITFANYNGDAIQNTEFGYNSHPTYNGADPTHANSGFWSYNFIGWVDKDEVFYAKGAELPVVKGVATYTAEYEAVDWTPEYTITFKDGDNKVLTTQTARLNAVPEYAGVTPTKTATAQYTYTFNNTWSPAIVAATKNETYTAQFDSELRSYTITFCNETGRELSSATFDYGATPVYGGETPKKARTGSTIYTFDGWSSTMGGAKLDELPSVSKAATYYAHFSDEPVYVVRFNAQGHGTAPANQEVINGYKATEPSALNAAELVFNGWYKEAACTNAWNFASDVVNANTTLYAKWTPAVACVTAGGNTTYHATVDDAITTATGKTNPTVTMLQDATTTEVTITDAMTIDLNGKTITSTETTAEKAVFKINASDKTVTIGGTSGEINHTANCAGKLYGINIIAGTLEITGGHIYAENTTTSTGTNYRAYGINTQDNATEVKVSGGTIEAKRENKSYAYGIYTNNTTCMFTMTGGTFKASGNATVRGIYVKGTTKLTDATITATGSGSYAVYVGSGSTTINSGWFKGAEKVLHGSATVKGGYYSNNADLSDKAPYYVFELTEAEKAIVGSDYNYKVAEAYNVTFNANGHGTAPAAQLIEKGQKASQPTALTATGYTFGGWYIEAGCTNQWNFTSDVVMKATPLYAKWTANPYKITFDSNGGSAVASITQNYGTEVTAPAAPTREGYTFAGWEPAVPGTMPVNGLTCVAQWTPKSYTITFDSNGGSAVESITQDYESSVTAPADPTRIGYTFGGWDPEVPETMPLNGTTCVAQWIANPYTIMFDSNGGSEVASITQGYGTSVTAPADPTRIGYTFGGWDPEVPEIMPLDGITCVAQWTRELDDIEVGGADNAVKSETIDENTKATTTVVHADAVLTVEAGNTLTTNDLVLEASSSSSGQISASGQIAGAERVTAIDNVYFDLILNTDLRHWRAFTVPFEIDLKQHPILADGVSMPLGVQYDIVYYDGAIRAEQGKVPACWRYVEDDANWILTPGKAYMIVFGRHVDVVRFTKKDEVSIVSTGTVSVEENVSITGNAVDGGWNGIGNPTTYHALISAGVTECQVHNGEEIGSDGYTAYDMDGKFVVGKAVFVQVGASPSVVVYQAGPAEPIIAEKSGAPRRSRAEIIAQRYDVQIAPADGDMADRIYLMTEEGKEDEYVILKDLAKAGISSVRAQMWIDRYGEKLCKNTTALVNGKASYPLSIYAPAAGEYEISVNAGPADSEIYLTLDGRVIWNLSYSGYMANLEKGTTGRYGLRVVSSRVPTGLEDATIENGETIRKVMIEDKVYIIRYGEMYTVTGQLVK